MPAAGEGEKSSIGPQQAGRGRPGCPGAPEDDPEPPGADRRRWNGCPGACCSPVAGASPCSASATCEASRDRRASRREV